MSNVVTTKELPAERLQSGPEEIANSVSHGLGVIAAIVGAPFLILAAVRDGVASMVVGVSIYSATMILLYLSSTLYHALPRGKAKNVFQRIEHAMIFLLIAGTYTPFTLGVLRGPWGWTLFGLIWALAAVGVLMKLLGRMKHPIFSTLLYVVMGWVVVIAIRPLWVRMPHAGLGWIVMGGLSYTAGVFFYRADHIRYAHFIWHLFVLAGTACHYFAILWYAS